jgi:PKD repeat protein
VSPVHADSIPVLSVFSEDRNSPDIVNPDLIAGTNFTIDILASNLPSITDENTGGLEGFDISFSYNSSVLKPDRIGFAAPLCPASDGCTFDVPSNDTLTYANTVNSPAGTARLAIIVLAQNLRAHPTSSQAIPTILFRASFLVVGQGRSSITIQDSMSQLIGYASGFCQPLSNFTVENGSFDNRPPFYLSASASSLTIAPGTSGSVTVTVNATRPGENVNATLVLSGIIPEYHTDYVFDPRTRLLNFTSPNFASTLSITTTSSSQLGTHPLEIVGAVPFADQHFSYRLPFNLTITGTPFVAALSLHQTPQPPQTISATIPSSPSTIPPVLATFTFPNVAPVGAPVSFSATVWCGAHPYTYAWNFGDGTTSTGISTTHTFATSRPYSVTLTVTDDNGKWFTSQQTVYVGEGSPASSLDTPTILGGILSILLILLLGTFILLRRGKKR